MSSIDLRGIDFASLRADVIVGLTRMFPREPNDNVIDAVHESVRIYLTAAPELVRCDRKKSLCWILTVARRILWREARRRALFTGILDDEPDGARDDARRSVIADGPADYLAYTFTARRMLSQLHPSQAEAVWLHAVERCKPADIAEMLGCSVNAVKHRLKRGYSSLRATLDRERIAP